MRVRKARADEMVPARSILDSAMLAIPDLDGATILVAAAEGRILGTLVVDGDRIAAVAVRPRRRDQGIGRALVKTAAECRDRLTAEFDERVRPFYEALGFEVRELKSEGRLEGRLR